MRQAKLEPLHAAALVSIGSSAIYVPVYLLHGFRLGQLPISELGLHAFFQGVMVTVFSLLLYGRAVAILGASGGAAFGALVPALSALLAIPLLGEWPTAADWVAIALVSWTGPARITRAEFLTLKQRDFVAASQVLGLWDFSLGLVATLGAAAALYWTGGGAGGQALGFAQTVTQTVAPLEPGRLGAGNRVAGEEEPLGPLRADVVQPHLVGQRAVRPCGGKSERRVLRGDDDVGTTAMGSGIAGRTVADGDRAIVLGGLLDQDRGHGLANDVAAPHDDHIFPDPGFTRTQEEFNDSQRRARAEITVAKQ